MEPIAIIGLGCRFPGAANPEAFWSMLQRGEDAIQEIPKDRWNIDTFYDSEPGTSGKMYTRCGGFIQQVDQFDPNFFGISPREAERMDPHQRLILELCWEALENAGIAPTSLSGSQTGVFIGIGNYDFGVLVSKDVNQIGAYDGTGVTLGVAANRVSYVLNLRGPSLAVETSCSSSLVAIHLACRSLNSAESDLCLVGAVNLMLSPAQTITYSQARMMAPDGRCKTFDARADGYVRGEGAGIVVLKRLRDAVRDRDQIQAVIRGTAVNQDGRSNGLTAPNGPSQRAVIRKALESAGVEPAQISYVEAHGTGTSLGDPIEVKSLKAVLLKGRRPDQPCWLGSVKTNIGHLEAAAGMAGLLKVVLSLQHQKIPPHLHLQQLNPLISLEDTPLVIPTKLQPWFGETGRLAGISSFGFGGTNAHIIVQETPAFAEVPQGKPLPVQILTLSAKSEAALRELTQRYINGLNADPQMPLADVCFTANTGRSPFDFRLAVSAATSEQMCEQLHRYATDAPSSTEVVSAQVTCRQPPPVAMLFTGQGAQYVGMGLQLYETQPTFREALVECEVLLKPYLELPLLELLYPQFAAESFNDRLNQTVYTQPALFAVEYALYKMWQSWGISPSLVMGHSVGEYVAACVAGVFSLQDGLKLIAARGRLIQSLPAVGRMVAVMDSPEHVAQVIASNPEVVIAAINGPESVVISGQGSAIALVQESLIATGIKTTPLQISHAFHSPLMEPVIADFEAVARTITYALPHLDMVSNVTGELITQEIANSEYWCQHLLRPVRFAQGMQTLAQQRCRILLEVGSKPILLGIGQQCLPTATEFTWLPSLRPSQSDWHVVTQSLAQLFVQGIAIDWQSFYKSCPGNRVALPTYPFQRQRYWLSENGSAVANESAVAKNKGGPAHPSSAIVELLQQGNIQHLSEQFALELSPEAAPFLPQFLETLVRKHQQQTQATAFKDWFYHLEWQSWIDNRPTPTSSSQNQKSGRWIILADRGGLGQSLAEQLRQQGHQPELIYAEPAGQFSDLSHRIVDSISGEDYELLFTHLLTRTSELPFQGIIHLWSLDVDPLESSTIATLEQAQTLICGSLLSLLKGLKNCPVDQNSDAAMVSKLWLITRGAACVGGSRPVVAQAPLWGFGKVAALEYPEGWGGMIDLDPQTPSNEAIELLTVLETAQGEDLLALRSGQRYVSRLVSSSVPPTQRQQIHSDSTYLITGGLGALGLHVAQWLTRQGARHIVLMGRRVASEQAQAAITKLEAAGAEVIVAAVDVTDPVAMKGLCEQIAADMPVCKGIIHAAGLVGYQEISELDWQTFAAVMKPKIAGAWLLHELTLTWNLDFFINFSSIASVWGSKGQAHYAAANAFLDALAHYRQGLGLPALSVNWGPWAEGGMASAEAQQWLNRIGVEVLPPEQALMALESLLSQGCAQATVADVNLSRFKAIFEARGARPLLSQLKTLPMENAASGQSQRSKIQEQLNAASEGERYDLLTFYLQTEVARILRLGSGQLPEPQRGFFDMGMDSLMAVELKTCLEKSFDTSLPATLAFESPTIQDLSAYLGRDVLGWQAQPSKQRPSVTVPQPTTTPPADDLLDVDMEILINARLAKLQRLVGGN